MRTMTWVALGLVCSLLARAEEASIAPADAARFVGETKTVCATVASTKFIEKSGKKPTFLNLEKPFPQHTFTVVIMGEHRAKFPEAPEQAYAGKSICVTGKIKLTRGKPEIEVTDPAQIKVQEPEAAPEPAPAPKTE